MLVENVIIIKIICYVTAYLLIGYSFKFLFSGWRRFDIIMWPLSFPMALLLLYVQHRRRIYEQLSENNSSADNKCNDNANDNNVSDKEN